MEDDHAMQFSLPRVYISLGWENVVLNAKYILGKVPVNNSHLLVSILEAFSAIVFRSLSFIEDYIREEVLPHYGNTHTTSTVTSLQTTMYRHEAR